MQILDSLSDKELAQTVLAELAKAKNEIKCARADIDKATSRINFLLAVANTLIDRSKD
jgi:hypothetical protein